MLKLRKFAFALIFIELLVILMSCASMQDPEARPLALVKTEGKYGFIRTNGEWHLEPEYTMALPFSEGLACVTKEPFSFCDPHGTKFDFIDQEGFVQFQMILSEATAYSEGMALITQEGSRGFIDNEGKLLVGGLRNARSFHEGLALVEDSLGQVGYINRQGEWQIVLANGAEFNNYNSFSNGRALFSCVDMGVAMNGYLDGLGAVVIPCEFKHGQHFSEGLTGFYTGMSHVSYMDRDGERFMQEKFSQVFPFSEGFACVTMGRESGFINRKGELIIEYDNWVPSRFSEGLVSLRKHMGNGVKTGYMDSTGTWLIEPQFAAAYPFSNGYARFFENEKCGFINRKGEKVIPARFEHAYHFEYSDRSNGRDGYTRYGE